MILDDLNLHLSPLFLKLHIEFHQVTCHDGVRENSLCLFKED